MNVNVKRLSRATRPTEVFIALSGRIGHVSTANETERRASAQSVHVTLQCRCNSIDLAAGMSPLVPVGF